MFALGACSSRSTSKPSEAAQHLTELVLTQTDHGAVQWTLQAENGDVREDTGGMDLVSPEIQLFKHGEKTADIRSDRGTYQEQSGNVHLEGAVVVVSHHENSTLRTEALDYLAAEQRYKTDKPVVIDRPNGTMRGTGLVANKDLSEIHVLHQESTVQ